MTARTSIRLSTLCVLGLSAAAQAHANIVVDGKDPDWAGTQTCYTKPVGINPSSPIQLNRVCIDNNVTLLNLGSLFSLYESATALPRTDMYFGFAYDSNNDGQLNGSDLAYAIHFAPGATTPDSLQVFTNVTFQLVKTYNATNNCGGPPTSNGWSGKIGTGPTGNGIVEMSISYGCLGLAAGSDKRLFQLGTYPSFDLTYAAQYNGTTGQLIATPAQADVSVLTAESGVASNTLVWNNPVIHDGSLILRSVGGPPTTVPTSGTGYAVGAIVGNATVVYNDTGQSKINTFLDKGLDLTPPGLVNGTRYFYKVYSKVGLNSYSSGNVPSPTGTFAEPTSRGPGSPLWCYTVGFPSLQEPVTDPNSAVFSSSNLGAVTANQTTANPSTDGTERWRPVSLQGPVQNRFPATTLFGRAGKYLLPADQSGFAYALNAQTGQVVWTANGGAALGTSIQAQPIVQLNQFSNAAFKAAHPNQDLIFVGTRNASSTNNEVFALNSGTGSIAWTYNPGNLDIISGGMFADYVGNQLFVVSRSNGNRQPSVRILNTLNGAELARLSLGDIDLGVNLDFNSQQAYVTTNAGTVYGISLATRAVVWSANVGPMTNWPWTIGNGFIASVTSGSVQRWDVKANVPKLTWSTAVAKPSGVNIDYARQKVLVGSQDGKIHRLDLVTGVDEKDQFVTNVAVGQPNVDATAGRVNVGTLDGRVCVFGLPF